jgi:hypothetical protein
MAKARSSSKQSRATAQQNGGHALPSKLARYLDPEASWDKVRPPSSSYSLYYCCSSCDLACLRFARTNYWARCTGSARCWGSSAACSGGPSPSSAPSPPPNSCLSFSQGSLFQSIAWGNMMLISNRNVRYLAVKKDTTPSTSTCCRSNSRAMKRELALIID